MREGAKRLKKGVACVLGEDAMMRNRLLVARVKREHSILELRHFVAVRDQLVQLRSRDSR